MEGLDNRQIAQRLGVSERTARAHTSGVLRRLGEPNRTRAAVAALRRGLLSCLAVAVALALLASTAAARTPSTASPQALERVVTAKCARPDREAAHGCSTPAPSVWWPRSDRRSGECPRPSRSCSPPRPHSSGWAPTSGSRPRWWRQRRPSTVSWLEISICAASGDPSLAETGLTQLARLVEGAGVAEIDGRIRGDESMFDARRGGPASGFGVSRWVGPLSALSLNHGSAWPLARGFQSQPPLFAARRLDLRLDRAGVDVARGARTGPAPDERRAARDDRIAGRWRRSCATWRRSPTTSMPRR